MLSMMLIFLYSEVSKHGRLCSLDPRMKTNLLPSPQTKQKIPGWGARKSVACALLRLLLWCSLLSTQARKTTRQQGLLSSDRPGPSGFQRPSQKITLSLSATSKFYRMTRGTERLQVTSVAWPVDLGLFFTFSPSLAQTPLFRLRSGAQESICSPPLCEALRVLGLEVASSQVTGSGLVSTPAARARGSCPSAE